MAGIEQRQVREADMPIILESTLRREAERFTDTLTDTVKDALATDTLSVRIGEFTDLHLPFHASTRDPDTSELWIYRRQPIVGGSKWVISCEAPDRSLETVQIKSPEGELSHLKPSIIYSSTDKKFQSTISAVNTQGATYKTEKLLERSSQTLQKIVAPVSK